MEKEPLDILVVGGGINGAGVLRDAAMRGLRVGLVEQSDFASGTSSRSSKLIHGGIRYLENLEFGLVFEALQERSRLLKMAPHLVHPLRFVLPHFKHFQFPKWKIRLGMILYDLLSLFRSPDFHRSHSAKEVQALVPGIESKDLEGAFSYYDALMDDDRLVIDTIRSAVQNYAFAASYAQVTSIEKVGEKFHAKIEDLEFGGQFLIEAKHIVSCVGPWTDLFGGITDPKWRECMRPSKGIHLVVKKEKIPLEDAVVMTADSQKRIVFAIPREEVVLIGTTDTEYKEDPNDPQAEGRDIEYVLNVAREYFPGLELNEKDIISSYAGIRPLFKDSSSNVGKTSREHQIFTSDTTGIHFVVGGKYTTYRKIAEDAVDHVISKDKKDLKVRAHPADTIQPLFKELRHISFQKSDELFNEKFGEEDLIYKKLKARFGGEAFRIYNEMQDNQTTYWAAEALQAIRFGSCFHLTDFYFRRTPLYLNYPDHGISQLKTILPVFIAELSWDKARKESEVESLKSQILRNNSWKGTSREV